MNFVLTTFCILTFWGTPFATSANVAEPIRAVVAQTPRPIRVAVVDMKLLFEKYYRRVELDKVLKDLADKANEELELANDKRLRLKREFKILDDNAKDIMLSNEERTKIRNQAQEKYREWREMEVTCEELKSAMDTKIRENYDQMRNIILKEIQDEVKRRALAGGFDLVLDSSGKSLNDMPVVIYASNAVDLTQTVLTELNKAKPHVNEPKK